jgi:hypothetical protein
MIAAPPTINGQNMYEVNRDAHAKLCNEVAAADVLPEYIMSIALEYIAPYICRQHPYIRDFRYWSHIGRWLSGCKHLSHEIITRVLSFLRPRMMMTEPIPCTITTIAKVANFDYDQDELIKAILARSEAGLVDPRIQRVRNQKGFYLAPGATDPTKRKISKHGRPPKIGTNFLFGKSQTTFHVKTLHRDPSKEFAVKVFQRNVSFETLGGLWVDCRDTMDVNQTVLGEIRAALNRPDIEIGEFQASMRNYRFELLNGYNIHLTEVTALMRELRRTIYPNLYCTFDPARYPAAIIEIAITNHTSKKKQLMIKLFQSGKINLDSSVYYEHVYTWYRFLNDFFIAHAATVLYIPANEDDEYDSDHYYQVAGVEPPPRELVD